MVLNTKGTEYKVYSPKNLNDHEVFDSDRDRIIASWLTIIDKRFSNVMGVVNTYKAVQIFDSMNWPDRQNELVMYGRNELGILLK